MSKVRQSHAGGKMKGERTPGKTGEPVGVALAPPPPRGMAGHRIRPVPEVLQGERYIPFIASHDTFGFMSAKAPVGFCFQAQTCSS